MIAYSKLILILAALAAALMAGLFYAWSVSVMPGIGRLSDKGFLSAMQAMNKAIMNPLFFLAFFGAALLLPVTVLQHYGRPASVRFWLLLAACLCYLLGVMGVTIAANVPLNNTLDVFNVSTAGPSELRAMRSDFEGPWNRWNHIRTVCAILTALLVIIACLCREKN